MFNLCNGDTIVSEYPIDLGLQAARQRTDEAANLSPTVKDHQRRDSLNTEAIGGLTVLIDIHLRKAQFALILIAQALEDRGDTRLPRNQRLRESKRPEPSY